jgi:2-dehydropantoate 2-reductase
MALAGLPVAVLGRASTVRTFSVLPLKLHHQGLVEQVEQLTVVDDVADLPPSLQTPQLAILSVKGYDTLGAIPTLEALRPQQILTLQNGLGNEEVLITAFGPARILSGAITTSVEPQRENEIAITKMGGVGLASTDGKADLAPWLRAFSAAGFPTKAYADYHALKWSKALLNMLGNGTAAILDMPVEALYADKRLLALDVRAAREALAVMDKRRIGIVNLPRYPAATLATALRFLPTPLLYPALQRAVGGGRGGKDPSLLRDMRAGRNRSEGEFLYGAISAAGAKSGVPTPLNDTIWRILGGISSGLILWSAYRGQVEKLVAECATP